MLRLGRPGIGFVAKRYNSSFEQLSNLIKQSTLKDGQTKVDHNSSTVNHVNELLQTPAKDEYFRGAKNYDFGATAKHPRDVAKSIRVQGPPAGRTVDVQYGNLGFALGGLRNVLRANRINYFKKVQARHIPPAKYKKQRKREWWRRRFSEGFKDLMAQVKDAKRRGY